MRVRTTALAAGAVALVAVGAAVVTLGILWGSPTDLPGTGSSETTRTLDAAETTALPGLEPVPEGAIAVAQARPLGETPVVRAKFDVNAAMVHVRALEAYGVRAGGSEAERRAAEYILGQLRALGLDARIEDVPLPNGGTSCNVVARVKGYSDTVLVLGAHMDSKPPSPGANDNASGSGALLTIAEILAKDPVVPTVEILFFGSEEIIGSGPDAHHFGSRYRVSQMSATERANCAGMISVDMIGYGPDFHSRSAGKAPLTLSDMVLAQAKALGIGMTFKKDTSSYGLSDHEAYERAGIPATCVCWRDDPVYHKAGDTSGHLSTAKIGAAGKVVLEFARGLDEAELTALTAR